MNCTGSKPAYDELFSVGRHLDIHSWMVSLEFQHNYLVLAPVRMVTCMVRFWCQELSAKADSGPWRTPLFPSLSHDVTYLLPELNPPLAPPLRTPQSRIILLGYHASYHLYLDPSNLSITLVISAQASLRPTLICSCADPVSHQLYARLAIQTVVRLRLSLSCPW
ncbi:hypothetical protein BDR07DRAFT_824858 [Suillus spraguei]|nr:hypothetical protein BDR07DRAFT_824858 [Suillus spraguei]